MLLFLGMNFSRQLLKFLKAKERNEIRGGKLLKITQLWGRDVLEDEQELVQPEDFKRPERGKVDAMRVHIIKGENNVTNLTKDADFL